MPTIRSACSTAVLIEWTVWSISTIAPFFIPFDFAVPTPIIFNESFKTSPITTLILAVPISKLTNTSLLFKVRHLLIQKYLSINDHFFLLLLLIVYCYIKGSLSNFIILIHYSVTITYYFIESLFSTCRADMIV